MHKTQIVPSGRKRPPRTRFEKTRVNPYKCRADTLHVRVVSRRAPKATLRLIGTCGFVGERQGFCSLLGLVLSVLGKASVRRENDVLLQTVSSSGLGKSRAKAKNERLDPRQGHLLAIRNFVRSALVVVTYPGSTLFQAIR